jgi:CxxC motif-containing protein
MKTAKELVCIGCPMGCRIKVELDGGKILSIDGYTCPKGKKYAETECTNPTRIVTSTVPVDGGDCRVVSVKTAYEIPKDKIFDCIAMLRGLHVKAPVAAGDIILKNAVGTGVDIVATKSVGANKL